MNSSSLSFSIKDFSTASGVCIQTVYNEINSGRLKTFKVGRRRFISKQSAAQWLKDRENESN